MLCDANLVTSGIILRPKGSPGKDTIAVHVADDYEFELIIYAYRSEQDNLSRTTQGNCAIFNCALGPKSTVFGTKSPIYVAYYNGKAIYLNFWISFLGADDDMMQIAYSIHMEV